MDALDTIRTADALLAGLGADRSEMPPSVQSLAASYERTRAEGSEREAAAHARALLRGAEAAGVEVPTTKRPTKADLLAEIDARNEGRAEADLIVVAAKAKVADLEQALADDDAGQG